MENCFQIHNEKLEFKVTSRIGSLANVKHKPGGGDKKIFDDKEYARQMNSEQSSFARSGPASMAGSQAGSHPQVQSLSFSLLVLHQSSVPRLFFSWLYTYTAT